MIGECMQINNRIPVIIESEFYEVLWHEHANGMQRVYVFHNDKQIGSKLFNHLTDKSQGVIEYAVKAVLYQNKTVYMVQDRINS